MYWLARAVNWSGQRDIYIDIETLFNIQNDEEKCEQVTHKNTWNLSGCCKLMSGDSISYSYRERMFQYLMNDGRDVTIGSSDSSDLQRCLIYRDFILTPCGRLRDGKISALSNLYRSVCTFQRFTEVTQSQYYCWEVASQSWPLSCEEPCQKRHKWLTWVMSRSMTLTQQTHHIQKESGEIKEP